MKDKRNTDKKLKNTARKFPANPVYLLIVMIVSVLITESIVVLILSKIQQISILNATLLNSFLLIIITLPLLYFLILKPYINERAHSEARYRSLIESTEDSIYLVDINYRYLYMNQKHLKRLGLSSIRLSGEAYGDFHSPEEVETFVNKVAKVFNTGESSQYEHKSKRDNKYFLQTFSPVKDINQETTAVTVISKDITRRKEMEKELLALSLTDELTGIYNRRGFLTLAEQYIKLIDRQKKGIFILYADLDNLKTINDNFGHSEGDRALIDISNILQENYRKSDITARIGGDEFVVIPVGTTEEYVSTTITRLNKAIEVHNFNEKRSYELSISIGIAFYNPEEPCTIEELLVKADKSMYDHKKQKKQKQ